ncbi:MAG: FAD-dependent oxidoreductase [Acidaminococcaceae bacterium]|nr:FAD-dependent oxidoreductase [Acidaminococcaceae bacterium]
MKSDTLIYATRELPIIATVDCCVVGGGTAGSAAAITSGRGGLSTLVVERGIALGGMQTLGLVVPFMPTFARGSDTPLVAEIKARLCAHGIEHSDGQTGNCWFNPEVMAAIYDELTIEAGVQVLYQATLVDVVQTGAMVQAVILQTVQGLVAVKARQFVDATGDALLARLAGVPVESGYEQTGYNQPMSFRFEMGGIDFDRLEDYIKSTGDTWCKTKPPYFEIAEARHRTIQYKLEEFFLRGVAAGELQEEDAEYFQAFTIVGKPGCMSMNCPELPVRFRATEALSYSEGVRYGRAMIRRLSSYLIKHLPGFEAAYLSREAAMLGARESFRIRGKYYLTEADYYARRLFADAVVRTAYYIDAHGAKVGEYLQPGEFYEIPYRSLVSKEVANLAVAGRCVSASFIMEASLRIQPTCMSMGEAVGRAAVWAQSKKILFNQVQWDQIPPDERSYVSAVNIFNKE